MATWQEHMIAVWAAKVETDGTERTIDGATVKVFEPPAATVPSPFERMMTTVRTMFHLNDALPLKVPGQIVDIDGDRWLVAEHVQFPVSTRLTVTREIG